MHIGYELYKKVESGKINKHQFLMETRKHPSIMKLISPTHSYEQVIGVLKRKGIIPLNEKKTQSFNLKQFLTESKKETPSLTRDQVSEYQYKLGIEREMKHCDSFDKAEAMVLKNLEKSDTYYTDLLNGGKPKGAEDTLVKLNEKSDDLRELIRSIIHEEFDGISDEDIDDLEDGEELSELAPETYKSASEKAYDRGQNTRGAKFLKAAYKSIVDKTITLNGDSYQINDVIPFGKNSIGLLLKDSNIISIDSNGNVVLIYNDGNKKIITSAKNGDKLKYMQVDRKTANLFRTIIKQHAGLYTSVDNFKVDGIHEAELDELAPNTYFRASEKASEKGRDIQAGKFAQAAHTNTDISGKNIMGGTITSVQRKVDGQFTSYMINVDGVSLNTDGSIEQQEGGRLSIEYGESNSKVSDGKDSVIFMTQRKQGVPVEKVAIDRKDANVLVKIIKRLNPSSTITTHTFKIKGL